MRAESMNPIINKKSLNDDKKTSEKDRNFFIKRDHCK